jgi:hypothetical protein
MDIIEYDILLKYFYKNLSNEILKYSNEYVLLDWIDINKLDWIYLSNNLNAIDLLKQNQNKINWDKLSKNPNAIELLKKNQNKINWNYLSMNPNIFVLRYNSKTLMTKSKSSDNKSF